MKELPYIGESDFSRRVSDRQNFYPATQRGTQAAVARSRSGKRFWLRFTPRAKDTYRLCRVAAVPEHEAQHDAGIRREKSPNFLKTEPLFSVFAAAGVQREREAGAAYLWKAKNKDYPEGTPPPLYGAITNSSIQVEEEHRRQGIATLLYDFAEQSSGALVRPASSLSASATKFWENRMAARGRQLEDVLQVGIKGVPETWSDPRLQGTERQSDRQIDRLDERLAGSQSERQPRGPAPAEEERSFGR